MATGLIALLDDVAAIAKIGGGLAATIPRSQPPGPARKLPAW